MVVRLSKIVSLTALLAVALGTVAVEDRVHRATHEPLPALHGRVELAGLQRPVTVYRDAWGAPHIYATTDADAFFAIGYVSAQERLFQMDLLRRVATGRLAEIVGPGALSTDKTARIVGFARMADASLPHIGPETRAFTDAYVAGVNAFIADAPLPIEFQVLGYAPEPWTVLDTGAIGNLQSWGLSMDWKDELRRAAVQAERGADVAALLMPGLESWGPYIINPEQREYTGTAPSIRAARAQTAALSQLGALPAALLAAAPGGPVAPPFGYASNNWVVDGSKTASGKPILANDPHLAMPMPGVWIEARVKSPSFDVSGVIFPGTPVIVLGHNRYIAWGATTTIADTQDLYIETPHPADPEHTYVVPGGVKRYHVINERILVKGGGPSGGTRYVDLTVRISRHGPIINELVDALPLDSPPLALRWAGAEPGDALAPWLAIQRATNWAEFKAGIDQIDAPIQNWVFACIDGDIGFVAAGRVPVRGQGHDPGRPVPGATNEFEWLGYIPRDELPTVHNPPAGYIGSANNKVAPPAYPYYFQGRAAPPHRAARIRELLESASGLTVQDMARMQLDDYMVAGRRLAPHFIRAARAAGTESPAEAAAFAALEAWDYRATVDSVGATVFHVMLETLSDAVVEDELSPELYAEVGGGLGLLDRMCNEGFAAALWDDRWTEAIETPDAVLAGAFKAAVAELTSHLGGDVDGWTWGRVHQQRFLHPFSQVAPWQSVTQRDADTTGLFARLRNVAADQFLGAGPFPLAGSGSTLRASYNRYVNGMFDPVWGVSFRHVVDMANVRGAIGVISTGNSGHVASPHYRDQVPLWLRGEYHPMIMDFSPETPPAARTLVLVPAAATGGMS